MLKLVPTHWFSWDFRLEDPVGMPWGELDLSYWRERGSVVVRGERYSVSRQGLLGPFLLEGPSGELARAVKVSAFRQQFTLTVGEREYTLSRLSWWRREFGLDLPGGVRAFVVWLTVLLWKRDADAAASSS